MIKEVEIGVFAVGCFPVGSPRQKGGGGGRKVGRVGRLQDNKQTYSGL